MTRPNPDALLTLDEAADLVGRSAIALVDALSDKPRRLAELLTGAGTTRGLTKQARLAANAYRSACRRVRTAGLAWIVPDQIEGALSYAGLDDLYLVERQAA